MHLRNRITAGFSALVHKKLKVANGLQTGCKGCKKSCKGCNIVRIPFLCYTKQGSGERVTTKEQKKRKQRRERRVKKRKRLAAFSDIVIILNYNIPGVICHVLMTDISILYVPEPDNPPHLNVSDWITSLLSSVHNPPSVNPSISAFIVGYQFGASIRLLVGG